MGAFASVRGGYRADGEVVSGQSGVAGQYHLRRVCELLREYVRKPVVGFSKLAFDSSIVDGSGIAYGKKPEKQRCGARVLFREPGSAILFAQDFPRPSGRGGAGIEHHGDQPAAISEPRGAGNRHGDRLHAVQAAVRPGYCCDQRDRIAARMDVPQDRLGGDSRSCGADVLFPVDFQEDAAAAVVRLCVVRRAARERPAELFRQLQADRPLGRPERVQDPVQLQGVDAGEDAVPDRSDQIPRQWVCLVAGA